MQGVESSVEVLCGSFLLFLSTQIVLIMGECA